jgi:hypothetical protein
MTEWYAPSANNYFGRVNRKAILTALEEAKGAPQGPGLDKLKKQERAERIVAGTGWLPALLRGANKDGGQRAQCQIRAISEADNGTDNAN